MIELTFHLGSIILQGKEEDFSLIENFVVFDERINKRRALASSYFDIISTLHKNKIPFDDKVQEYNKQNLKFANYFEPLSHQEKALKDWQKNHNRGVVVLPTGAGKSYLAMLALFKVQRSSLIVVPTIELLYQWQANVTKFFNIEVGLLGGGNKDVKDITISTYESALLMMEFIGNKFGLLIVDECHHLPSLKNSMLAKMIIAPFRLGLSATPERTDGGEVLLYQLLGGLAFRMEIDELDSDVLSDYEVKRIELDLSSKEQDEYDFHEGRYREFLKRHNIYFSQKTWADFLIKSAQEEGGKDAFYSYMKQRNIACFNQAKIGEIWQILKRHQKDRIIIFTHDNNTAYSIAKTFCLPVISYQTKANERKYFLDKFKEGVFSVLVTSKVLNEGVDVPQANIAIIASGSGSIREHVQRLGRILRKSSSSAILYELISKNTSEFYISERRRKHRAYESFY